MNELVQQIFTSDKDYDFNHLALKIFRHQADHCLVYKEYLKHLGVNKNLVYTLKDIPYLPISFFKTHDIISGSAKAEMVFSSSGTTGMSQSKHLVTDVSIYEHSFKKAFDIFYGSAEEICLLALLPSYLEREGSSLIYMVDALLRESAHPDSGYFLHNHADLYEVLQMQQRSGQKTLLIGVTYALLDFLENYTIDFPNLIVMETGGMKGKRKEMVREELHEILTAGFGVAHIHSEYGMTELLSQAYSKGNGSFSCPPWMKIVLRDTNDPLSLVANGKTGGINIIDLANVNSCSFIATQDLGKLLNDGSFEVLGRFDNSDVRGCNLLVG